jgi:predicted transcriptional regulator
VTKFLLVTDQEKAVEVVKVLADEYSRRIILSIITNSLPIEEISKEQHIPVSTCYRRIHEMLEYGIVRPDRTIIQEDGKKFICYKSSFKNATIQLESGELKVDLVSNRDPAYKLSDIWSTIKPKAPAETTPEKLQQASSISNSTIQKVAPTLKL